MIVALNKKHNESKLQVYCGKNYNLALHGNYCVSNWFSLPFAYKRKREREGKALTLRALAREYSARSAATLRAGAQLNVKKR